MVLVDRWLSHMISSKNCLPSPACHGSVKKAFHRPGHWYRWYPRNCGSLGLIVSDRFRAQHRKKPTSKESLMDPLGGLNSAWPHGTWVQLGCGNKSQFTKSRCIVAMGQNPGQKNKIAGKWVFIPLKLIIGFDPCPFQKSGVIMGDLGKLSRCAIEHGACPACPPNFGSFSLFSIGTMRDNGVQPCSTGGWMRQPLTGKRWAAWKLEALSSPGPSGVYEMRGTVRWWKQYPSVIAIHWVFAEGFPKTE